jgi:hypothetical protein
MKKIVKVIFASFLSGLFFTPGSSCFAGNEDRAGQAGGQSLLVNPWARSNGWAGANSANSVGLEAMFLNVAGTAFTKKTEIMFAHNQYMVGSGTNINSFGFTQRVGETGVLGMGIVAMDFGNLMVTTVNMPEGGLGTFKPNYLNLGVSYAKEFSNSIYGGIALKVVSESTSDIGAQGVALDAGVKYVTGDNNKVKFGIALKNVGPRMSYKGDGLAFRGVVPSTGTNMTVEQRSESFDLPSLVNIGGSYDFLFDEKNRLTVAGNFTSNSFTKDQYSVGLEYGFRNMLLLRGGYVFENGISDDLNRSTAYTGPAGGFTFEVPLNDKGTTFSFDYAYRFTNPFNGSHVIGARINL